MAKVTPALGKEEVGVIDFDVDGTAQAVSLHVIDVGISAGT
jgi:hypothetical protein